MDLEVGIIIAINVKELDMNEDDYGER